LAKSDDTNSKHQHRVTELDGQGSEGALYLLPPAEIKLKT